MENIKRILIAAAVVFFICAGHVSAEESPVAPSSAASGLDNIRILKQKSIAETQNMQPFSGLVSAEKEEQGSGRSIMKMFEGLGYCLVAFLVGVHLYKRFYLKNPVNTRRRMRVIEKIQVSPKASLLMVEVDGKELVLAVGSERTSLIRDISDNKNYEFDLKEYEGSAHKAEEGTIICRASAN